MNRLINNIELNHRAEMADYEVTDLSCNITTLDSTPVKAKRLPRSEKKRQKRLQLRTNRKEVRKEKRVTKKNKKSSESTVSVPGESSLISNNCDRFKEDKGGVSNSETSARDGFNDRFEEDEGSVSNSETSARDGFNGEKTEDERRCKGHRLRRQRLGEVKSRCKEALVSGQRVCVDCSLGGHMTERGCSKLAQQIGRLYGSNRKSKNPLHIYLSGLKKDGVIYRECARKYTGFESFIMDICEEDYNELFQRDELVYLTPDSENVLETLDKGKVYVIGGLVDESAKKKVTVSNAEKFQLNTARFPIDKYMTKAEGGSYKKSLTVNQVVDILLMFAESGDWVKTLAACVPKRTGFIIEETQ